MNQALQALKDCWSCVPVLDTNDVCAAQKNIGGFEASDRLTDLTQIYFIGWNSAAESAIAWSKSPRNCTLTAV